MGGRIAGTPGADGIAVGPLWRYLAAESPRGVASVGAAAGDPVASIRAAAAEAARQLESLAERMRGLDRGDEAG
ncbi:MAG TPA: hypothetical protein VJ258_02310, partial [Candidatus Limnocylindrales bacterium]|nr:hypothetical protein [Candidatus Limnocylindrales bacterium]